MSAFMLDDAHIDVLITFARDNGVLTYDNLTPDAAGDMLARQNRRSLNDRYDEAHPTPVYRWTSRSILPPRLPSVAILKACDCYDYQACKTDDYDTTPAARLVDRIRRAAIRKLPGYAEAPWGISDLHAPAAFTSARRRRA